MKKFELAAVLALVSFNANAQQPTFCQSVFYCMGVESAVQSYFESVGKREQAQLGKRFGAQFERAGKLCMQTKKISDSESLQLVIKGTQVETGLKQDRRDTYEQVKACHEAAFKLENQGG